jgi:DNA modification methylase
MTELPPSLRDVLARRLGPLEDSQRLIPRAAKDAEVVQAIEATIRSYPTSHLLARADARTFVPGIESVHLVLTSPPYWTLKRYNDSPGQLGHIGDYDAFLDELDEVWRRAYEALVPGGRLVCVVGDVCLSRRQAGRHMVVPLHASIQERARNLGFDNLAPIFWHKISNAKHEVERSTGSFLGKPYEPNGVVKHDVEYILMLRKPGGYRSPMLDTKILSLIPAEAHRVWFQQIWSDVGGASTRSHPAPYPLELAERLVRMFSFVGDTVLDPFTGTGTTNVAAARWGRNSIGVEIDEQYFDAALERVRARMRLEVTQGTVEERRASVLHPLPAANDMEPTQGSASGVPAA